MLPDVAETITPAELLSKYRPLILSVAVPGDPDGAEDRISEARLQLLALAAEYEPDRGIFFGAYLKRKLRWRMFNYRRHIAETTGKNVPLVDVDALRTIAGPDANHVAVRVALDQLRPRQREVLIRFYWLDQSIARIAGEIGCSTRNVNMHREAGERRLKVLLAG